MSSRHNSKPRQEEKRAEKEANEDHGHRTTPKYQTVLPGHVTEQVPQPSTRGWSAMCAPTPHSSLAKSEVPSVSEKNNGWRYLTP